jgi:hypothetical protein
MSRWRRRENGAKGVMGTSHQRSVKGYSWHGRECVRDRRGQKRACGLACAMSTAAQEQRRLSKMFLFHRRRISAAMIQEPALLLMGRLYKLQSYTSKLQRRSLQGQQMIPNQLC